MDFSSYVYKTNDQLSEELWWRKPMCFIERGCQDSLKKLFAHNNGNKQNQLTEFLFTFMQKVLTEYLLSGNFMGPKK